MINITWVDLITTVYAGKLTPMANVLVHARIFINPILYALSMYSRSSQERLAWWYASPSWTNDLNLSSLILAFWMWRFYIRKLSLNYKENKICIFLPLTHIFQTQLLLIAEWKLNTLSYLVQRWYDIVASWTKNLSYKRSYSMMHKRITV